jgi:8-oxo-dGTP pyrophosphatase MutT (NUDIX family)
MTDPIVYKKKMASKTLDYKFYPTDDLLESKNFKKLKKVRCIAIDDEKRICMVSYSKTSNWMLPGGTVERKENPILTMRRELVEEADIEIKNYKLIGFLEFHLHNNLTNYDLRQDEMFFVAKVAKVLPQTNDPDLGFILQREFFPIEEVFSEYMKWGKISKFLLDYALKLK